MFEIGQVESHVFLQHTFVVDLREVRFIGAVVLSRSPVGAVQIGLVRRHAFLSQDAHVELQADL